MRLPWTPGLRISVRGIATEQQRQANARAFRERVQEQGLDVDAEVTDVVGTFVLD